MNCDVIPWLLEQSAFFVEQLDSYERFPVSTIGANLIDSQMEHQKRVDDYKMMLVNRRIAEEQAQVLKLQE